MDIYKKYKTEHYKEIPDLNPLSFILRKAELGKNLTESEWSWLDKNQLIETKEIIKSQEDYREELTKELRNELLQLRKNPFAEFHLNTPPTIASERALILYKINLHERLSETEVRFVNKRYHQFLDFNDRKNKYGITESIPFDSNTVDILLKLETKRPLSTNNIGHLINYSADSFLKLVNKQFFYLQNKYQAFFQEETSTDPFSLFYILQKIDENQALNQDEISYLKESSYTETLEIIQQIKFSALKVKYKATEIQDNSITHHLCKVLTRLDSGLPLTESDINYLKKRKLHETVKLVYKKETDHLIKKINFAHGLSSEDINWCEKHDFEDIILIWLKNKYNIIFNKDEPDSPLYIILRKLEKGSRLNDDEIIWLESEKLLQPPSMLLTRYCKLEISFHERATEIKDKSIANHLYTILIKLDSDLSISEADINYLKKRKLNETVKFIFKKEADYLIEKIKHGYELRPEDIAWCEAYHFENIILKWLKIVYIIKDDKKETETLYIILRKLEDGHRLNDEEVIWLEGEKLLKPTSKIFVTHHRLEALYYENEFQRTKDHWKLASASAHWRKSEASKKALSLTDELNFKKIKPAKLRAALMTTRGGAFRDINEIDEAKKCALAAISYFSESHNPYTLMGALCYDERDYFEGDKWFEKAIKRGAKPRDHDAEIKRILRKKSNQELIDHLIKKDPQRFAWVKAFARKNKKN